MRILNNELTKMIEVQPNVIREDKALLKLMALLDASSDKTLALPAELQTASKDKLKVFIEGVGVLELPVADTVPTAPLMLKARLVDGNLQLQLDTKPEASSGATQATEGTTTKPLATKWLEQLNLPKNEHFVEAANLLETYKIEPSAEKIKLLAEGSFLALKLKQATPQQQSQLVDSLMLKMAELPKEEALSLKQLAIELLQGKVSNQELKPLKEGQVPLEQLQETVIQGDVTKNKGQVDTKMPVEVDSKTSKGELTTKSPLESTLKSVLQNFDVKQIITLISSGDYSIDNLDLHKKIFMTQEIGNHKHEILDTLKQMLGSENQNESLKQSLVKWLETSENPLDDQQLQSLKQIIQNSEQSFPKEFKEQVEQLLRASEQLSKLPDYLSAMHLPIALGQQNNQLEVYYKKRQQRAKDEPFRMLIALDTKYFSQVKVLVTDSSKELNLLFKLDEEETKIVFESERGDLLNWVEALVNKPVYIKFEAEKSQIPVLEAMRFLGEKTNGQLDVRV